MEKAAIRKYHVCDNCNAIFKSDQPVCDCGVATDIFEFDTFIRLECEGCGNTWLHPNTSQKEFTCCDEYGMEEIGSMDVGEWEYLNSGEVYSCSACGKEEYLLPHEVDNMSEWSCYCDDYDEDGYYY